MYLYSWSSLCAKQHQHQQINTLHTQPERERITESVFVEFAGQIVPTIFQYFASNGIYKAEEVFTLAPSQAFILIKEIEIEKNNIEPKIRKDMLNETELREHFSQLSVKLKEMMLSRCYEVNH